jgi:hypothetical protein
MPGEHRCFRSLEQYQEARQSGTGTKMNAILNAVKYFTEIPCASMPKMNSDGTMKPMDEQDPPYRASAWDVPDKLLLYTKFTLNFPLIISVCPIFLT